MKDFVFDPAGLEKLKDPVYLMYRGVNSLDFEFKSLEKEYGVRYDLTLIKSGLIGLSYVRTIGHYHPNNYSEIYEVIRGKAAFVLQSKDLKRMILVTASEGEAVIIPRGFGHQTVNIGEGLLLIGNLVYGGFKSDYSVYKKHRGGAFYLNKIGKKTEIMINTNYRIPLAMFPKIEKINGIKIGPLDAMLKKNPGVVSDFLKGRGLL